MRRSLETATATGAAIDDTPTGTVAFALERPGDDDLDLGSASIDEDGLAVVTVDESVAAAILPGSNDVVATYSGDPSYLGSTSRHPLTTTPQPPVITSDDATTFTAGVAGSFEVTTTGVPAAAISIDGTLPVGMTFTDHGDGTGEFSGVSDEYGTRTVNIVATNDADTSTDAVQAFELTVAIPEVGLPEDEPPVSTGSLTGVPPHTTQGQEITVTATGFAPNAPVAFGIYSTVQTLGTTTADETGVATADLVIPTDALGEHRVVAAGMAPDLDPMFLHADTVVSAPPGTLSTTGGTVAALGAAAAALLIMSGLAMHVLRRRSSE